MSTFTEKLPPDRGKRRDIDSHQHPPSKAKNKFCFQNRTFGSQRTKGCFEDTNEQDVEISSSKCQAQKHL